MAIIPINFGPICHSLLVRSHKTGIYIAERWDHQHENFPQISDECTHHDFDGFGQASWYLNVIRSQNPENAVELNHGPPLDGLVFICYSNTTIEFIASILGQSEHSIVVSARCNLVQQDHTSPNCYPATSTGLILALLSWNWQKL